MLGCWGVGVCTASRWVLVERLWPASSVALSGLSVALAIATQGSATLHPALMSGALTGLSVVTAIVYAGLHPALVCGALSGLSVVSAIVTQGSATLHPALISGALSGLNGCGRVDEIGWALQFSLGFTILRPYEYQIISAREAAIRVAWHSVDSC